MANDIPSIIAGEQGLARKQVAATIRLFEDGATIPFISHPRSMSSCLRLKSGASISSRRWRRRGFLLPN